jgi:hypothetical protein
MKVSDSNGYFAGILYTTQKMIHEITAKSGPLAINNEYQVHWEGITFRLSASDNSFIDITIPTVVFNYPQEVSSAYISFDLKKVTAMREALTPLIDVKEKEAIAVFHRHISQLASQYNLTVQAVRTPLSNIHRHPGGLDRFSGTDYDTNPTNPGIVFPFSSAAMTPIYSSIILHNQESELAHTEYRVANKVDDNLTYYKGKCVTYCKGYTKHIPSAYSLMYQEQTSVPSVRFGDLNDSPLLSAILAIFDTVEYNPDTSCVLADNLSKPVAKKFDYSYSYKPKSKHKEPTPHVGTLPSLSTFIDNYPLKYGNKLFTINGKQYLTIDLYDAVCEADEYLTDIEPLNTFNQLFAAFEKQGVLDLIIEPYEEETDEIPAYLDETEYSYKPKYPSPIYGKAARK